MRVLAKMGNCNLAYALCILLLIDSTTQDNSTSNIQVTKSASMVGSTVATQNVGVNDNSNVSFFTQPGPPTGSTSNANMQPISQELIIPSPWDHITNYFRDFRSQVVALDLEFCGRACRMNHTLRADIENDICDYCACDENCEKRGDCCPDLVLLYNKTQNYVHTGCFPSYLPASPNIQFYLMVNSCPTSYNTSFIKTMCEHPPLTDWPAVVPQINMDTGTSFRNTYCAQCHGQNTSNWATSIICSSFDSTLQDSTSLSGLFNATMRSKICDISFQPPFEVEKYNCKPREGDIIGRCNVTGKWSNYDKNVDDACNLYSHIVLGRYRNVFCFYCNNRISWVDILKMTKDPAVKNPLTVPLTALLNMEYTSAYRYRNTSRVPTPPQFKDNGTMVKHMKECQNLSVSCAEGKQLKGDECHSLFASSNMYGYRMCFQINITLTNQLTSNGDINMVIHMNVPRVNSAVIKISKMTGYVVELENCPDRQMYVTVRYVMFIYSVLTLNRDQFEKQLMEDNTMLLTDSTEHVQYHAACSSRLALAVTLGDPKHCSTQLDRFVVTESYPVTTNDRAIYSDAKYIQLSKQLNCPRVLLEGSNFVIRTNNALNKLLLFPSLFLLTRAKLLEHDQFQTLNDGSVTVCVKDYINISFEKTYSCHNVKILETETTYLSIVSFVCTLISLLFLAMTFGTYCMFASMRTLGGVCNMGLIATIFAAQAVFEFGIEQNEDAIGCQVIGILIHFLWLAAVFWMNACTFLLFLKLSFPLRCINLGFNRNKIFLLSALYSNTASGVVVFINIIVNIALDGHIGYGGNICYLNTNFSQIYFFKIPMGIIVILNIIMFVLTLCKIEHQHAVSSTRESKINLLACVKLSVITGLVWLFSYLYEVFQITAFAYLFTLFVGSQGVLFFLAIVLNKNVRSLWCGCFKRQKNLPRKYESTTSSSRLDNSNQDGQHQGDQTANTKM